MKPFKLIVLLLYGMAVATSLWGEGLLRMPGEWTPFMEWIDPKEFLIIENALSESRSDTDDLVIYDASQRTVDLSMGIRRLGAKGSRLEIEYIESQAAPHQKKLLILPPDITDRLFSVFEFALTNQVYAPKGKTMQYLEGSSDWINLRIDKNRVVSGRVFIPRCGTGFESSQLFRNVLSCLTRCAKNDSSEGPPLLLLDLAIDKLRLSYPDKK